MQVQLVRVHGVMSNSMPSTVHVAIGGAVGAALAAVAARVVVVDDNVLLGPSSADPRHHRDLRAEFFGAAPSTSLEEALARAPGSSLCVYLPPTPNGLLSLCRICALMVESEHSVSVVDLRPTSPATLVQGSDPAPSALVASADVLRDMPRATPWSTLQVAFAATLWRLWCRRSPTGFSRFCASGGALHPQLANLGRYHAGVFPRWIDRRLALSRLDELLLRRLSQDWATPARIYVEAATSSPALAAWLSHTGDEYVAERLLAWFHHTEGRIVDRQEAHKGSSSMLEWSYRWRPGGETILDALPTLETAPPVGIGGAVAYEPDRPWACRVDVAGIPHVARWVPTPANLR
jgi:hypothetical protein